ncbi:MAG: response regulator [Candidatus Krumholzibacteriia bacterium]
MQGVPATEFSGDPNAGDHPREERKRLQVPAPKRRPSARRPIRILIADNHKIALSTLKAWLQTFPDVEVIGGTRDADEAVDLATAMRPDVVILDIRIPHERDGFAAARKITSSAAGVSVLMISSDESGEYVRSAFTAGALGFVTQDDDPEHLIEAIRVVQQGHRYCSPRVSDLLLEKFLHLHGILTRRERQILQGMADGSSTKEMSLKYGIAERTVDAHKQSIYRKLHARTQPQAVRRGKDLGLLRAD